MPLPTVTSVPTPVPTVTHVPTLGYVVLDPALATASSDYGNSYVPASAFDSDNATSWNGCCTGYPNQWLQYSFPSAHTVTVYKIMTTHEECPVAWVFQGSNDGNTWSTVHNVTGQACHDYTFLSYTVSWPGSYVYYRWYFSQGVGGNSNGMQVRDINIVVSYTFGGLHEMALCFVCVCVCCEDWRGAVR